MSTWLGYDSWVLAESGILTQPTVVIAVDAEYILVSHNEVRHGAVWASVVLIHSEPLLERERGEWSVYSGWAQRTLGQTLWQTPRIYISTLWLMALLQLHWFLITFAHRFLGQSCFRHHALVVENNHFLIWFTLIYSSAIQLEVILMPTHCAGLLDYCGLCGIGPMANGQCIISIPVHLCCTLCSSHH